VVKKIKEGSMKELNELNFPDDVRYAESHEWARTEGDKIKVGISD
jgi:glycine cleavage system H protein